MTKETIAAEGGPLFADKGKARPASGLRSIYPENTYDEEPQVPVVPAKPEPVPFASNDDELAEAANLQAGGFKSIAADRPTPTPPDAGARETVDAPQEPQTSSLATAGPAHIDSALAQAAATSAEDPVTPTTGLLARSGSWHPLIIGGAFAALLLASLGIGYGVSLVAGGGASEVGTDAPRPEAPGHTR